MAHLRLVCDQHIPAATVDWLKNAPGRHKVVTAFQKGWGALDDSELIVKATEDRRVLVTEERSFESSETYPICTHSGIVILRAKTRTERHNALDRWLMSGHRDRCKHAIVTLTTIMMRIDD